ASAPAPVPTSRARSSPRGKTKERTCSASSAARASCRVATRAAVRAKRSGVEDDTAGAGRAGVDAADELVGDGAGDAGVLLGERALSDQHNGRADLDLVLQLDGERINRDGADDAPRLAGHADGRA